jgi:outer membrane protein insertion porin family
MYTRNDTTYSSSSTGGGLRLGFPLNEYWSFGTRYVLSRDDISLDKSTFFRDPDGSGPLPLECDPLLAGRYLCDEIGARTASVFGFSTAYDNTDAIHPTRGQRLTWSEDFAGLGGDVKYIRSSVNATKYHSFGNWIFSAHGEGGYIVPLQSNPRPGVDAIRLTDRFFGQDLRGFDIRGIGPRIQRVPYSADGTTLDQTKANITDALGGRAYYMGRLELEFPTSSGLKSVGLRPSAFVDVGSVWNITTPNLTDIPGVCTSNDNSKSVNLQPGQSKANCDALVGPGSTFAPGFREFFLGDTPKPRLSIGIGVNWTSPFGPLRIDLAKALLKQPGDNTKLFSFNVGTQF